ncbi:MAG: hypothetical protein GY820_29615 [Gammaproteobacteria bacterium]|nr:hypothetical protein [Gammaproteobacteria bacterium]
MKISMTKRFLPAFLIAMLAACGGGGSSSLDDGTIGLRDDGTIELKTDIEASGTIAKVGEVDWYRYNWASDGEVDAANTLSVRVIGSDRQEVDLLVAVFEKLNDGSMKRLISDHATEQSVQAADIRLNVDIIDNVYISVRDYMDDEASDKPYFITIATLDQ